MIVTQYAGASTRVFVADGSGTELDVLLTLHYDTDDLCGAGDDDLAEWLTIVRDNNLPDADVATAIADEIDQRRE